MNSTCHTTLAKRAGTLPGLLFFLLLSPLTHAADSDGDGLDDSVETNTGIYVDISDTGTDPGDADTDNDTIPDGLDLPPTRNPLVADWAVSAGGYHSCALDDSGVVCWGAGTTTGTLILDRAWCPTLSNPQAVSAGAYHSCALDDSGVVCWGRQR